MCAIPGWPLALEWSCVGAWLASLRPRELRERVLQRPAGPLQLGLECAIARQGCVA
jgi:hypothetical protein